MLRHEMCAQATAPPARARGSPDVKFAVLASGTRGSSVDCLMRGFTELAVVLVAVGASVCGLLRLLAVLVFLGWIYKRGGAEDMRKAADAVHDARWPAQSEVESVASPGTVEPDHPGHKPSILRRCRRALGLDRHPRV